jgi:hypothetical protein
MEIYMLHSRTAHGLSTGSSPGARVGVTAAELVMEMQRLDVDYVLLAGYLKVRGFAVSPLKVVSCTHSTPT